MSHLYRSYPAALAEPLLGVVACSDSLANFSTGLKLLPFTSVLLFFRGDTALAPETSEHGILPETRRLGLKTKHN